jgi:hypothetical protein
MACQAPTGTSSLPRANVATCALSVSPTPTKILDVSANTTGISATWRVKNDDSHSITIDSQSVSATGNVSGLQSTAWTTFPVTLSAGSQIDPAIVLFDAGAAGNGSVTLTLALNCGTASGIHLVRIH